MYWKEKIESKDLEEGPLYPKPVVEIKRCLRSSPGRSKCAACQDACPVPGFHLEDWAIILPDNCCSCHLCTAACPEGAIRGFLPPSRVLNQDRIVLRCERVYKPGVVQIACVGAIPISFLEVAAVKRRSLHLITGPCERCERRIGLDLLEQRIARIHEMRSLIWIRAEQPFCEVPERRRLLGWLGRSIVPYRMGTTDYGELLSEEFILHANRIRPILSDRCVGCPVCEAVCPVHVFHRCESATGVRFRVDEELCTGCKKCVDNCLFQGIVLERNSLRRVRTVELEKQICADCNEVFFGHVGACPRCRMTEARGPHIKKGVQNPL